MNINFSYGKKHNSKSLGFTLAEVLVVIVVLGVVASMTIPTLMNSYSEKEIVTKLIKTQSMLSQATLMINAECGGSITGCLSDPSAGDNNLAARREVVALYKANMKIIKDCDNTPGCFTTQDIFRLDESASVNYNTTNLHNTFILNNGTCVSLDWDGLYSGAAFLYRFIVDLNYEKPPNKYGRDVFIFLYNPNTNMIEPGGVTYYSNSCNLSSAGSGCAERVLREKAINY